MLVVERSQFEEIVIGDPSHPIAVVSLQDIRGSKVRIGIQADKSIPVNRREIADAIVAEANRKTRASA
jgi:carbon storage regulator CsrA